ncbi:hypothetical protein CFP71_13435 [Amycolatopsis thailandensis]|uniref:SAM-dependent methyltransferase n=1 Tax=Amycolatopsis thailandensis TaxID=589330 RepID=A0A229SC59_9PSEU|nr:class I SAM-dependent methyltransferase [Amycolatopsis thailandensis]OXM56425.1 hypothetical protein CFP71_13435 [Amycolatopsis thailandensis]
MRTTIPVDDTVRRILAECRIDDNRLYLPDRQLDRKLYKGVNTVLEALGGTWNRRAKAHLFTSDPSTAIANVVAGGTVAPPATVTEGYFATPAWLAEKIVTESDIPDLEAGAEVLEPSAGDGALVRAILDANPGVRVTAIEPNPVRAAQLGDDPRLTVVTSTLEDFAETAPRQHYAAAVMNPPFALPGQPTIWISHVLAVWNMLAAQAQLIAVVPSGFTFRRDKNHESIRQLITTYGGYEDLPEGAFAESGTGARTVLLHAHRADITA